MDRWTDRIAMAKMRYSSNNETIYMARKKF